MEGPGNTGGACLHQNVLLRAFADETDSHPNPFGVLVIRAAYHICILDPPEHPKGIPKCVWTSPSTHPNEVRS